MNNVGAQSIFSKQFVSSSIEPIVGLQSLVFLVHNVLTLGVYAAATVVTKKYVIKQLEINQKNLEADTWELQNNWNNLEKDVTELLSSIKNLDPSRFSDLEEKLAELSQKKTNLEQSCRGKINEEHKFSYTTAMSIAEVAFGTISFVGELISNIATMGLYGVYKHHSLKNRLNLLQAKNNFLDQRLITHNVEKSDRLQQVIGACREALAAKDELTEIRNTDAGQAYLALQQVKKESAALKQEQNKLQNEITALKTQYATTEAAKKSAENELATTKLQLTALSTREQLLSAAELKLNNEKLQLQHQLNGKDKELKDQKEKATQEFNALLHQYASAVTKANRVGELEGQLTRLKATQSNQPDIVKLAPQLGPIPPKYTPRPEDKECPGAMDVNERKAQMRSVDVVLAQSYNERYEGRSASVLIETSFRYACEELFALAEPRGDLLKLNRAGDTLTTLGIFAVYRFMALDLIKGGKVELNGCHGFKLQINGDITMLPSLSERVMKYKLDAKDQSLKPLVKFHYQQRDDFTPDEDTLGLRDGVDPVSVKWILNQLSKEETDYLFIHLMSPVIENNQPDYLKMRSFMQNRNNPRVQLIEIASELIQDIATAFSKKFGDSVLIEPYGDYFYDWELQPFIKAEDNQKGIEKIQDFEFLQGGKIVEWELDVDVLSDKRSAYDIRQNDFYHLITKSQAKYRSVLKHLGEGLLNNPRKIGEDIQTLKWDAVNLQYHYSHQMIGYELKPDIFGLPIVTLGEQCLFSNLLAILVGDKKDLTSQNVQKLKNAMAAYLDKLQRARQQWLFHPQRLTNVASLPNEAAKLKELAELAKLFEDAILKTHQYTVTEYQNWLRGSSVIPLGKKAIDLQTLTPFEIQLAAFMLGVRIGLLPIDTKMHAKIDQNGRIICEGFLFGPNTKELLMMAYKDNTYYGLFPKVKIDGNEVQLSALGVLDAAIDLTNYWESIDPAKNSSPA